MQQQITVRLRKKPKPEPRWSVYDSILCYCAGCQEELDYQFIDCDTCFENQQTCEHFACSECGDVLDLS